MVRINLLPGSILAERARQRARARFIKIWGLIFIILLLGQGYLYARTSYVKGKLAVLAQEKAVVDAETARYIGYTRLQADVKGREALLKKAMGAPLLWADLLEEMGGKIPANVWLTDFTLTYAPADEQAGVSRGQLVVRGLTYDHPSTAAWVNALRDVQGVVDVRCAFSAEESTMEMDLVRFELRAALLPGTEYEPLAGRGK